MLIATHCDANRAAAPAKEKTRNLKFRQKSTWKDKISKTWWC